MVSKECFETKILIFFGSNARKAPKKITSKRRNVTRSFAMLFVFGGGCFGMFCHGRASNAEKNSIESPFWKKKLYVGSVGSFLPGCVCGGVL